MHEDKILEQPLVSQPKYNLETLTQRIRLTGDLLKTIEQCTEQEFKDYLQSILSQMYHTKLYATRAYDKSFGDLDLRSAQDRVQALNEMDAVIEQRKIDCHGKRRIEVSLFVDVKEAE